MMENIKNIQIRRDKVIDFKNSGVNLCGYDSIFETITEREIIKPFKTFKENDMMFSMLEQPYPELAKWNK